MMRNTSSVASCRSKASLSCRCTSASLLSGLGVGHLRHLRGHGPIRHLTRLIEVRSLRKRGEWLNGTRGIETARRPWSINEQGRF